MRTEERKPKVLSHTDGSEMTLVFSFAVERTAKEKRSAWLAVLIDPYFHEPSCEILMEDAGHKCLVRHTFLDGSNP
jgi:hypothetical protein